MSATYCFQDRALDLFSEACARGYLQAILDFPRCKDRETCMTPALRACEDLRNDVCCVQDEDAAYQLLVTAAWINAYVCVPRDVVERDIVFMAAALKRLPYDEALRFVRPGFTRPEGRAELERGYAQFVEAISARS